MSSSLTNSSALSNNSNVKTCAQLALIFSAIGSIAGTGMVYYDFKQKKLLNNSGIDNASVYDKYTFRYAWLKEGNNKFWEIC